MIKGIIYYTFIGYLAGALLVAIRLGWHMAFRLDRFDWLYSKSDIWGNFVLSTLLWPVIFLKPQNFIDPRKLFEDSFGIATRRREEARLWNNPPSCGPFIRYQQRHARCGNTFGEFTFRTIDLEEVLVARLRQNPHLATEQEGAILNWFRQRDASITEPTDVPEAWERFEYIAENAVREGKADVHCLKCNAQIPSDKLLHKDDNCRASWISNRLVCPLGHPLLVVETVHIKMRRNDGSSHEHKD